jgi:CubicO group peptidase (beta-lactamase class C family)
MRFARLFVVVVLLLSTAGVSGQRAATSFAPDRLARIDDFLQRYVQENRIPGAVALVLRDGRPVYDKAVGWSDKEAGRRMTTDTLFRIASQTKAITSTAVMMLLEEGRLGLGSPASEFIPEFENTTVAVQTDGGGQTGQTVNVVPAKRRITVFDLLTHTSGISYGTDKHVVAQYEAKGLGPAAGWYWYTADKDEPVCDTMERLASLPFVAQPGESYVYGYNTDVLGCIVERASGMPLDRFIESRITGPLGMKDTRFFIPPDQRQRLAAVYASGPDGRIVRAPEGARGQGHYVEGPRKNFSGGAGLVSTARDYARFLEMIRRGGELDGVRLLSPRSVALMTSNQIGTIYSQSAKGLGFGLAFESVDRYGANGMASVGSFAWGGAYATRYHVDPEVRMTLVFMMQVIPSTTDVREKFQNLVYSALLDGRAVTSEQR